MLYFYEVIGIFAPSASSPTIRCIPLFNLISVMGRYDRRQPTYHDVIKLNALSTAKRAIM